MTNKNAAVQSHYVCKVKDSTEKCSVIKITYRHTYSIPIGRTPVSKLNHGALFRNIFNFAKCVAQNQNVGARYLGRALQILFLLLCHVKQNFECKGGKKGPGSPGTLKKVPGILDFFSSGTKQPRYLQGL